MRETRAATIAALVTLLLIFGAVMLPWLRAPRTVIASTPSLNGLVSAKEAPLAAGAKVCVDPAPLTPEARSATFTVSTREPQRLRVRVTAPGYRAVGAIPPTYPAGFGVPVTARLSAPPPRIARGIVCLINIGAKPIGVVGTDEPRSLVPARSLSGGKELPIDVGLTLYGDDRSILTRFDDLVERAGAFAGLPAAVAWLVALLTIVGVPGLSVAAIRRSFSD